MIEDENMQKANRITVLRAKKEYQMIKQARQLGGDRSRAAGSGRGSHILSRRTPERSKADLRQGDFGCHCAYCCTQSKGKRAEKESNDRRRTPR